MIPNSNDHDAPAAGTTALSAEIDAALAHRHRLARFGPLLNQRYNSDTRYARAHHLRSMILLGVIFFMLYGLSGFVTAPALGPLNFVLRLLVMTPAAMLIRSKVGSVGDGLRENLAAIGMVGATAVPVLIFVLEDDGLAPLTLIEILLSLVYANTTLALRFPQACIVSGTALAATLLSLLFKPVIGTGLAWAIVLHMVTGVMYSLVANYRIERTERRNYLLTLRETLRTNALAAHADALATLSTTDALTGLHNRHVLDARVRDMNPAIARGAGLAAILIDVDFFKSYNDHYGHSEGDLCLQHVAEALRSSQGPGIDIMRFGGEEFLILLNGRTIDEALSVAKACRRQVERLALPHPERADGCRIVTVSLGVADTETGHAQSVQTLIEQADAALYEAKALGRNRVQCSTPLHVRTAADAA